jgi:hypothetical protein
VYVVDGVSAEACLVFRGRGMRDGESKDEWAELSMSPSPLVDRLCSPLLGFEWSFRLCERRSECLLAGADDLGKLCSFD